MRPLGPDVDAFEAEVAAFVGVEHALALSSGSAALHLALLELGAGPGRVVVLPTMTFAATANAIAYTGATPVFVDALREDANVDPALLVEAVDTLRAEGADVCAVVTVDLFGRACDYAAIEPALAERGIPLVEDAAEALGATRGGRSAGAFGRASALSFNGNKIMTTSGGGMLLSDDGDLVAHARKLSTQAREPVPVVRARRGRLQLPALQPAGRLRPGPAARGCPAMIERRRAIRARYAAALEPLGAARSSAARTARTTAGSPACVLPVEAAPDGVTPVLAALNAPGHRGAAPVEADAPQPVFAGHRSFLTGVADDLFARGCCCRAAAPSPTTTSTG